MGFDFRGPGLGPDPIGKGRRIENHIQEACRGDAFRGGEAIIPIGIGGSKDRFDLTPNGDEGITSEIFSRSELLGVASFDHQEAQGYRVKEIRAVT